jgi:hypothetical protein
MFHTIRRAPGMSRISFSCTSTTSSVVSATDISSGLRASGSLLLMGGQHN